MSQKHSLASTSSSPLQTVDRALEILSSFDEERTDWGVTELAQEFNLSASTAQRLLASLAQRGFLYADPITRRYRLGPAVWRMASLWERTGGFASLCQGYLNRLARLTGSHCIVTIPDGAYMRCVASAEGETGPLRTHEVVGELYPAHAGATSRAYFAFLPIHQRRDILAALPLAKYSKKTLTQVPLIEEQFEITAQQGWAFSEGEFDSSTEALAAPIKVAGRPVASISIGWRSSENATDRIQHLPLLLEVAADLGQALNSRRPRAT